MEHGEPNEQSYYEVALTNRQVLVAFVLLLGCMLVAFFSGLWVGRGGAARQAASTVARAEVSDEVPLEEFRFFAEDRRKTPVPTPTPIAPQPGRSLAADVGAEESPAPVPSPVPATPAPTPVPQSTAAPATPPPPEPAPPRATAAPAVAPAGAFYVQVFSSGLEERARRFQEEVGRLGHAAFISKVTRDGREIYRVRVGPFATREEGQPVLDQIRQRISRDAILTDTP